MVSYKRIRVIFEELALKGLSEEIIEIIVDYLECAESSVCAVRVEGYAEPQRKCIFARAIVRYYAEGREGSSVIFRLKIALDDYYDICIVSTDRSSDIDSFQGILYGPMCCFSYAYPEELSILLEKIKRAMGKNKAADWPEALNKINNVRIEGWATKKNNTQ